jgi:broad specificity phosphatase PhoE
MPVTHFIIRHGQTDWNAEYRLQGQRDIPLNETGRAQATGNGIRLAEVAGDLSTYEFVSSPLGRARETMERLRTAAGLNPSNYSLDERLIEICFGDWEGYTSREIKINQSERYHERHLNKWDFIPPGDLAESYEILSWRVGSWLKALERPTVAVCHGGVIRCIFKLTGGVNREDAANLDVPQDRILRYGDSQIAWV